MVLNRKIQSLDGLRAIAILLVFFNHMHALLPVWNQTSFYCGLYVQQGWIGVDLFFVLSGFLITGILIDSREAVNYFRGFYIRRILRIFPLYYLVLTGIILGSQFLTRMHAEAGPAVASLVPLVQDRWIYFCYLTNWTGLWKAQWGVNFSSILAHFWSLAIEEQFYFVWPFIVWFARPRLIPWIAGTVAGLSAMFRLAWACHMGVQMLVPPASIEVALATVCRLDGLFVGALCAYFFRDFELALKIRKWLPWVGGLGIGTFFVVFSLMLFFPQRGALLIYGPTSLVDHSLEDAVRLFSLCGGYTLLAIGFGAWVLLAAYTETERTLTQRFLKSRTLGVIGKYSYGIYVFHVPIIGLAAAFILPKLRVTNRADAIITQCAYAFLIMAVSFIIPALSYEFFEKRILSFKRYFEPKYERDPSVKEEIRFVTQAEVT